MPAVGGGNRRNFIIIFIIIFGLIGIQLALGFGVFEGGNQFQSEFKESNFKQQYLTMNSSDEKMDLIVSLGSVPSRLNYEIPISLFSILKNNQKNINLKIFLNVIQEDYQQFIAAK